MLKKVLEYITDLWYSKIRNRVMNMYGINICDVAAILVNKFNNDSKTITQLKLQKMLYFIEAYYMAAYNKKRLYKEEFVRWAYGPVSKKIYDKYRCYMNLPITVINFDDEIFLEDDVNDSINQIYDDFGNLTSTQLIALTHRHGSPWYCTPQDEVISKEETKKWFKELFLGNGS